MLRIVRSNVTVKIRDFSDASHLAMAAAVYVIIYIKNDEFSVRFVCSKTRITPCKRFTIPRLAAALLLTRLVAYSIQAFEHPSSVSVD